MWHFFPHGDHLEIESLRLNLYASPTKQVKSCIFSLLLISERERERENQRQNLESSRGSVYEEAEDRERRNSVINNLIIIYLNYINN